MEAISTESRRCIFRSRAAHVVIWKCFTMTALVHFYGFSNSDSLLHRIRRVVSHVQVL